MNNLKKGIKARSKKSLFNPYLNGISTYDIAYLSSKRIFKNKTINIQSDRKEQDLAA